MVFFVCSSCGSSLKKNQIEKHTFQCRSSAFSCIDCNKDFFGDDYKGHMKCLSEIERYSAKGWKPPANHNKGEKKQNEWTEIIQATLDKHVNTTSPACKNLLYTIGKHDNVPRKKAKFINFIRNVARMGFNETAINEVWSLLEAEWKTSKQPVVDTNEKLNTPVDSVVEQSKGVPKKKKQKSELNDCKQSEESVHKEAVGTEEIEIESKRKKRKKESERNGQLEDPLFLIHATENVEADAKEDKKLKKKREKKTSELNGSLCKEIEDSVNKVESLDDIMTEDAASKKKRKKKKSELSELVSNEIEAEYVNEVEPLHDSKAEDAVSKNKRKNKKSELNESLSSQLETESESLGNSMVEDTVPKKKKKKSKNE